MNEMGILYQGIMDFGYWARWDSGVFVWIFAIRSDTMQFLECRPPNESG